MMTSEEQAATLEKWARWILEQRNVGRQDRKKRETSPRSPAGAARLRAANPAPGRDARAAA